MDLTLKAVILLLIALHAHRMHCQESLNVERRDLRDGSNMNGEINEMAGLVQQDSANMIEDGTGDLQMIAQRSCGSGVKCDLPAKDGCGKNASSSSASNRQRASLLAQNAAKEAKAASDAQQAAGQQASHQVKTQLAEKACQANNAAQAALVGKQQIVDQLEEELREAEAVVQEEGSALGGCQTTVQVASQAALEAKQQVKILAAAMQNAQSLSCHVEKVAEAMAEEQQEKEALLEAAKHRIEALILQLNAARSDLAVTKCAANKAAASAQQAKQNAMRNRRNLQGAK